MEPLLVRMLVDLGVHDDFHIHAPINRRFQRLCNRKMAEFIETARRAGAFLRLSDELQQRIFQISRQPAQCPLLLIRR